MGEESGVTTTPQRVLGRWDLSLVALVSAAIAVRISLAVRLAYFADEQFSIRAALLGPGMAWRVALDDLHPPLYNFLLALWIGITGAWPEWHARMLSILIGSAWVLAVHRMAARHVSRGAALLAAGIIALHPFAVQFTEPARWYGLYALLATLVADRLELVLSRDRLADRLLLAGTLTLAGWTHVYGVLLALLSLVVVALYRRRDVLLPGVLTVASLLPLAPWFANAVTIDPATVDRTALRLGFVLKPLLLGFSLVAGGASYPTDVPTVACCVVLAAAAPMVLARKRGAITPVPIVIAWAPTILISGLVLGPFSLPHYYLALLAPLALCVAWLADHRDTATRVVIAAYIGAGAIGLVHLLMLHQVVREEFTDPWNAVATTALQAAGTDGVILTNSEALCLYADDRPNCVTFTAGIDSLNPVLAHFPVGRVAIVSAPQSGARDDVFDLERVLPTAMWRLGYALISDTGLVRTNDAALRRRFSTRPFPDFRVRLLVFVKTASTSR